MAKPQTENTYQSENCSEHLPTTVPAIEFRVMVVLCVSFLQSNEAGKWLRERWK